MSDPVFQVVIPARHASTRLPGKPLLPLLGRPMLQWVHQRALGTGTAQVTIATDDERILQAARGFGAHAMLTAGTHTCGSERIAEVARREGWADDVIVVNLQGDEPLMPATLIRQVVGLLHEHPDADLATLAHPLGSEEALLDPNVVKVVCGARHRALYFSRAPIPWVRDSAACGPSGPGRHATARRHIGLYAYRVGALLRLASLPPGELEQLEKLEQLRALENGMQVCVADARVLPGPDVNTPADIEPVEAALRAEQASGAWPFGPGEG